MLKLLKGQERRDEEAEADSDKIEGEGEKDEDQEDEEPGEGEEEQEIEDEVTGPAEHLEIKNKARNSEDKEAEKDKKQEIGQARREPHVRLESAKPSPSLSSDGEVDAVTGERKLVLDSVLNHPRLQGQLTLKFPGVFCCRLMHLRPERKQGVWLISVLLRFPVHILKSQQFLDLQVKFKKGR